MTLPTFLGIGVPKGGTTWLYELLTTHPAVYIPTNTKGLRFFNQHFDLGTDWYQQYFPADEIGSNHKAIGEITAHYLYCEECPQRITGMLEQPKLILMLRNPVDRTWSHYRHTSRLKNYQDSFDCFLDDFPNAIRFSLYSEDIKRYQTIFDPDQMLILLSDQVFADIPSARKKIASFLDIDPADFPPDAGLKVVNKGFIPRHRNLYALIARSQWLTRNRQIHWPGHLAKKIGLKRLISVESQQSERMTPETRKKLLKLFDDEISELETVLEIDLSHWRT